MTEEDMIKMHVTKGVKKISTLSIGRFTGMIGVVCGLKAASWILRGVAIIRETWYQCLAFSVETGLGYICLHLTTRVLFLSET